MHPLRVLGLYILAVFVGGALLAPWLYFLAQWGTTALPALEPLAASPFHRFVNRSLLILGILGLWPFFKYSRLTTFESLGLKNGQGGRMLWARGFVTGLASLALAAALVLSSGVREWHPERSAAEAAEKLLGFAATAMLVAVIEEILFRGAIHSALRRAFRWPLALLISSGIYALVHFFQKPPPPDSVTWTSGLVTLGQMLRGFVQPEMLWPGFLNLTMAGFILGLAYEKTRTLYFSIGLHAGWIFWLKAFAYITDNPLPSPPPVWGTARLIDGYGCFIWMALILVILMKWPRFLLGREAKPIPA